MSCRIEDQRRKQQFHSTEENLVALIGVDDTDVDDIDNELIALYNISRHPRSSCLFFLY